MGRQPIKVSNNISDELEFATALFHGRHLQAGALIDKTRLPHPCYVHTSRESRYSWLFPPSLTLSAKRA